MIVFNLDARPQNEDLRFCVDYSAKIIRSAISIPLLKKNKFNGKIENGLCNVVELKNNKTILSVNDFWFSNGEKLQPKHIKSSIEFLLENDNHSRMLLVDLNKIIIKNDIIILLHNKNIKFVNLLTNVKFSPFNDNGDFCGKFIIKENKGNYVFLESNKYNSKFSNQIKFNFIKNNLDDIKLYNNKMADFTNPTTFPLMLLDKNQRDLKCYKNYIFFNLTFSNRKLLDVKYRELRETIYKGISRNKFVKDMSPLLRASYNFKMDIEESIITAKLAYHEPIYLTIGYDNFYPNKEICEDLKQQLQDYNIFLILKETDYYNRNTKYDLQLNLTNPDYIDDSFYYCSRYFELLIKLSDYANYKRFKKYKNKYLKTDNSCYFDEMCKIIDNMYLEIPLYVGNAVYLSKNNDFNFVDLNFESFDVDKC